MGRLQTDITRERIRRSLKKFHPPFIRKCPSCQTSIEYSTHGHVLRAHRENQICRSCKISNETQNGHYSNMGKKSAESQSTIRRSKNEIHFSSLCKEEFSDVETNRPMFNGWDADVIIHDKKIAVLWNGIWHHQKITKKHSVLQVQNRDKLKVNEIIKCGYTPYVIEDMGKENPHFVKLEFEKFILTFQ